MLLQSLQEMGERAEEMIRVALDSLANRDLQAAESLVDLDELIDRSNRRFVERVVEIVAEPGLREWVLGWCSSRGRSSGSAITRWTSASRSRTC